MKILILIPAFNEEKNIQKLISRIQNTSYDYLVINDASTDGTKELLEKENINHISLSNNMGIAHVLQVGYRYAYEQGYDAATTLDGDGQHDPKFIESLLTEIEQGYDYVIGSRFVNEKKPWSMRMLGSRVLVFIIRLLTKEKVSDPTSGMKVVGRNLLNEFYFNNNFIAEPDTLVYILKNGYKVKEVQVEMEERSEGASHFNKRLNVLKFMIFVICSMVFIQSRKVKRR